MRRLSKASSAVSTSGTGLRRSLHGLTCLGVLGLAAFTGSSASAATDPCANAAYRVGPSATLADCRAYEQVSPVEKGGNQVKSALGTSLPNPGWSSSDGNTALYNPTVGPALPDPVRGFNFAQIGERTSEGWVTRVAANGPSANAVINGTTVPMINQLPSEDRKSLLFVSGAPFTLDNPNLGTVNSGGVNLARGGSVEWLSKPIWAAATPTPGHIPPAGLAIVGATPDLSTAFFTSWATLTPEDGASGRIGVEAYTDPDVNRGLYRWKGGQLSNAGQLPDGTLDPWG